MNGNVSLRDANLEGVGGGSFRQKTVQMIFCLSKQSSVVQYNSKYLTSTELSSILIQDVFILTQMIRPGGSKLQLTGALLQKDFFLTAFMYCV